MPDSIPHVAGPQLAQFNVARLAAPLTDPRMADFVARLDAINAVADRAPGFVWRWRHPFSTHTMPAWVARARMMFTLSVWADVAALKGFVYGHVHADILRQRRAWFTPIAGAQVALWWVPAGARPTLAHGQRRLRQLRRRGPSDAVFNLNSPFGAPS